MHTVGAPSTSGMGAHPLIARLRQHVVPPRQPHQLSSLGFRAHPPNSPQGRAFLLSASPRSSAQNARSTAEMDSCGSSGPVPAARREEPGAPDLPGGAPAGRAATRKLVSLYWAKNWDRLPGTGPEVNRGGVATVLVCWEALPSLTVLTGSSAGGLGRSLERACSREFVVYGSSKTIIPYKNN